MDELIQNYRRVLLQNYANFEGRARRKEFWMFALGNFLVGIGLMIVGGILGVLPVIGRLLGGLVYVVYALFCLAIIVPSIAVAVRRLHDTDKSGWMLLLGLIPIIGGFIVLYFYVIDSQPGPNRYGPNPKELYAYGSGPATAAPYA